MVSMLEAWLVCLDTVRSCLEAFLDVLVTDWISLASIDNMIHERPVDELVAVQEVAFEYEI